MTHVRTIALRFADNTAPCDGTIAEHKKLIDQIGYVWYGKYGNRISSAVKEQLMELEEKRILLIHSGKPYRYWLIFSDVSFETPDLVAIPEYYRENAIGIKTWFRATAIKRADNDVMSRCVVVSSKQPLSWVSKYSMSPYFIIDYKG